LHFADDGNLANNAGTKDDTVKNEQLDAWSAHRTDTGVVYYYNALTCESTYEKPSGFKGEVLENVSCLFALTAECTFFSKIALQYSCSDLALYYLEDVLGGKLSRVQISGDRFPINLFSIHDF